MDILEKLYYTAEDARKNAYAPYSKFKVGAALMVKSEEGSAAPANRIYTGVNIENSSFGATLCAERLLLQKQYPTGF